MSPSTAESLPLMPCEVRVSSSNMFLAPCLLLLIIVPVASLTDLTSELNKVAILDHGIYAVK